MLKRTAKIYDTINSKQDNKKETFSFSVQVNMKEMNILSRRDSGAQINASNGFGPVNILTERCNQQQQEKLFYAKLAGFPTAKPVNIGLNNLCVIGQKVE